MPASQMTNSVSSSRVILSIYGGYPETVLKRALVYIKTFHIHLIMVQSLQHTSQSQTVKLTNEGRESY